MISIPLTKIYEKNVRMVKFLSAMTMKKNLLKVSRKLLNQLGKF